MDCESLIEPAEPKKFRGDGRSRRRDCEYDDPPDDLASLFMAIIKKIKFKIVILLFMAFILINTSTFIDSVLSGVDGAVDGRIPTEKGIVTQGIILMLIYIVLGLLVDADLI